MQGSIHHAQSRGYQSDESTLASENTDRGSHDEGVVK